MKRKLWLAAVGLGIITTGPVGRVHASFVAKENTKNWAGYEVLSKDNHSNRFTWIEGSWTVLGVHDVYADDGHKIVSGISTWVGLGGSVSPILWQAGTEFDSRLCNTQGSSKPVYDGANWTMTDKWCNSDGCNIATFNYNKDSGQWVQQGTTQSCDKYAFWFEDYGCSLRGHAPCPNHGYPVHVDQPTVSPGDRVWVRISDQGQVTFTNLTSNESDTYTVSIDNNLVGTSAEWVIEQHCASNFSYCLPLSYDDPQFSDAYAYGNKMSTYVDYFRYRRDDLATQDYRQVLAQPTRLDRQTHGFSVLCCDLNP
jgi:Peptidase A4 family